MAASPLAKKLLIRPGNHVLLLNPPEGYLNQLGELPEDASIVRHGPADIVHLFVNSRDELAEHAASAVEALTPGGVLWVSYPKVASGRSNLSREVMQSALVSHDWRPVTQVFIDETWSAMRFRPTHEVKSSKS